MLAPEPFFEPRGTPFSEYHRVKALVELGYQIDLVTYPIGQDVELPNLRIYRSSRVPFVRRVAIGPSFVKILLDLSLAMTAIRLARRGRYAAVHSHEEAGALGVWLASWLGIPHLYDMHSSLPQQLSNFGYSRSRLMRRVFEWSERLMIDRSRVVITICQALQDMVTAVGAGDRAILIENVMGGDIGGLQKGAVDAVAFTSSPQVRRLFKVARKSQRLAALRDALGARCVAAVGPLVADTLAEQNITVDLMPESSYFMKPLVRALADHFTPATDTGPTP